MKYQPVSCEFHSKLEVQAMRGTPVPMVWREGDELRRDSVLVLDVYTENGEEWLLFSRAGEERRLRLDYIESIG